MEVWIWLAILVVSLIIEFVTLDLISIWLSAGSLVALILALLVVPLWVQVVVAIVITFVCLLAFRKVAMKYLLKNKDKTNLDLVVGKILKLEVAIADGEGGIVKINGVEWKAVTEDEQQLEKGTKVQIVKIQGTKAIVKKA